MRNRFAIRSRYLWVDNDERIPISAPKAPSSFYRTTNPTLTSDRPPPLLLSPDSSSTASGNLPNPATAPKDPNHPEARLANPPPPADPDVGVPVVEDDEVLGKVVGEGEG